MVEDLFESLRYGSIIKIGWNQNLWSSTSAYFCAFTYVYKQNNSLTNLVICMKFCKYENCSLLKVKFWNQLDHHRKKHRKGNVFYPQLMSLPLKFLFKLLMAIFCILEFKILFHFSGFCTLLIHVVFCLLIILNCICYLYVLCCLWALVSNWVFLCHFFVLYILW